MATVLGVALTMTAQTPVLGREAAQLDGFTQADGSNVFALTLKPSASAPAANGPRDVVILVSTAASQTGDFRAKSLATLQSTLTKLEPERSRQARGLRPERDALDPRLCGPRSPEMAAALGALNQRTPLGSCDLEKALDTAAKSFAGDSKSARAIVYIGDGSSRANVLTADQLDRVVNDLVAQRAPVIAFGVGPRIQEQMLGILASRTGGLVVPEQASVDAGDYGTGLAQGRTRLGPLAQGRRQREVARRHGRLSEDSSALAQRPRYGRGRHREVDRSQADGDRRGRSGRRGKADLGHSRVEVQCRQRLSGHPGRSGEGRRRPNAAFGR